MSEILFEKIAHLIHDGMRLVSAFFNSKASFYIFLITVTIFFSAVAYYYLIM